MIQNQQLIFSGMDKDTDESKYQKTTCLENFNVRFINTESNVIGTLQNERDYKVILTCNNLNTDNVTCEKIIGHLKYDSNRLCLFFVNQFGNIVVADLEFNEQTKEFAYVKREDNPHITTIQYAEDEIVQCTFGEDTYANYIFWTSENSGGLQKYLVDAKNVNLLGEPVFPFEGITKVEIRDGGMIPQGMVKYFISTTNDLGVESNKWDTDWYYVKDNDIEKTKQIVLTINIPEQDKIRNVIIYRLQHTSGGVTAHCVGNYQPSESIVIDNGTSQIPIDPDLLLQQNHINDNVNCLKVFQDRLFVSTKKDDSDIEAKWEDENINYSLVTKELDSPNDSLSKTTHFYDGNGYVFGLEFLDSNGEVKLRVKSNKFGFTKKEGKFANGVELQIPNKYKGAYPYARAFVAPSEMKKFLETGIVNPTLAYYEDRELIEDVKNYGGFSLKQFSLYFPSSIFRSIQTNYKKSDISSIVSKTKLCNYDDGNNYILDLGCSFDKSDDASNLDIKYLEGKLIDKQLINSSTVEYRHGFPLYATGSRGCEFAFCNVLNGWYGIDYYAIEGGIDQIKLDGVNYSFYNKDTEKWLNTTFKYRGEKKQITTIGHNIVVNGEYCAVVLPYNNDNEYENSVHRIQFHNIIEFKSNQCFTFADVNKAQGETTEESLNILTDSTFGLNGLVYSNEDKYSERIGVCMPRVCINPSWIETKVDNKEVKHINKPKNVYQYNCLYTPLYSPLNIGGIDIKQKTINIRKGISKVPSSNLKSNLNLGTNAIQGMLSGTKILQKIYNGTKYLNAKVSSNFSGLFNSEKYDIRFSECANPDYDYSYEKMDTTPSRSGTKELLLKRGQILSRVCCGIKFDNTKKVEEDGDHGGVWSAFALSREDTKSNYIGFAKTADVDKDDLYVCSGLFNWDNREFGEKTCGWNACVSVKHENFTTKSDTPINYTCSNSILIRMAETPEIDQKGADNLYDCWTKYPNENPFMVLASIEDRNDPQRQDKIMYQASTIQSTANGYIYATIGDVYKGEQRYIATIPDASCPNQVLDIIDAEVYTTTDPNCYYKMEDESLLLHTDDYNKAFRRNPNLDSEGARKMIYEFTGIIDNKTLDYVDYRLYWSLPKSAPIVEGTSAFDKIFSNSSIDLDQTAGAITKIESFGDKLFVFQETKVSVISYNERGIVQLEGTNPISIMNEQSVQGFTPMTDHFGLQKHYQCCKTDKGIYWLDSINKELFMIDESCQVDKTGISIQTNMYSWFIKNASKNFVLYYNYFYKDLMMSLHGRNGTENITLEHSVDNKTFADSIAFSEFVGGFSSFYDLYRNNIGSNIFGDSEYMVNANGIYEWSKGQYTRPFYTCFVASENSFMDKVFYNLDYHADCYIRQGISDFYAEPYEVINQREKLPKNEELYHPAFTHFRCWNNYQDTGIVDLTFRKHGSSNLKRLFRTWRIQIPRDKKVKRDRIRNQWAKILLGNHKINEDRRYSLHDFVLTFDTK